MNLFKSSIQPYIPESLPLPSLDWTSLIPSISEANAALARYDGILQGIINPEVLLSPLTTQEAVLSSRIEGTEATLEEVLEFEATPESKTSKQEDIREIINYRQAVRRAIEDLRKRPISLNMIKEIHSVLLNSVRGQNKGRGDFRTIQNWIGRKGCTIEEATFVPPAPLKLLSYLSDFEKYIHFDEKDKLVQLAIIHAQFELIHPFIDGNGRVGRILIPLFLYEKKMLSSPMFYLSAFLEEHRETYYEKLQLISENGDWRGWIVFFLRAIIEQSKKNSHTAKSIMELYERMKKDVAELTRSTFSIQVLDSIFDQPIFTTTGFIHRSGIPKASAMRILRNLQKEKVLIPIQRGSGRRPSKLIFAELIELVENRRIDK